MTNLGERLRKERERKGLALGQVHEATKIQTRYLAALEKRDWKAFPGEVFLRGYLRTYADYLKLDPEQVLKAYARERRLEHTAAGTAPADPNDEQQQAVRAVLERIGQTRGAAHPVRPRVVRAVIIGSAGAALCVLAAWSALQIRAPDVDMSAAPEEPGPSRQTHPAPAESAPTTASENVLASRFADGAAPAGISEPLEKSARERATLERASSPSAASARRSMPAPEEISPPPSTEAGAQAPTIGASPAPSREPAARPVTKPESPAPTGAAALTASGTDPGSVSGTERDTGSGPAAQPPRLSVPEHGVGTGIDDHQLVGVKQEFAQGTAVWFWTLVRGGRSGDQVRHVWIHEGRRVCVVPLRVGGPEWRTQRRRIMAPGSEGLWTVEARDPKDRLLATSSFRVESRAERAR